MKRECDLFRRAIDQFLAGGLNKRTRKAFLDHAAQCESCRKALAEEKKLVDLLVNVPRPVCPERVVRRIIADTCEKENRIRTPHPDHRLYWRTVLVSGVAVAVLLLLMLKPYRSSRTLKPDTYTEEELELAKAQLKWSLSYVAQTVNEVEKNTLGDVLMKDMPETVKRIIKKSVPLFRGGSQ